MTKSKKIFSQKSKSIVVYAVHIGQWAIDNSLPAFPIPSSTKIDDRPCRAEMFNSKKEAFKFAKKYIEQWDSKWLAYVEIKKCNVKVIEKLK